MPSSDMVNLEALLRRLPPGDYLRIEVEADRPRLVACLFREAPEGGWPGRSGVPSLRYEDAVLAGAVDDGGEFLGQVACMVARHVGEGPHA